MKKLVLASVSPSRKQILETLGVDFEICPSSYEEDMSLPLKPQELAIHLSQGKAREVANKYKNAVIVAADSFAVYQNKLLGKPHTARKAREMLMMLSGQVHSFITGFTIIDTESKQEISEAIESKVYFRKLTKEEIDNYIAKENVLEKAGAYSIQGLGMLLIDKVDGDYSNIRGLPVVVIAHHLKKFGIQLL
ncbi:MAG TPA: nucleoside triphosphate pyrophosphatase [Candidatus Saccharimonadales bacterium]|nr:nucleoside triphosphate pyrophosphatase [Candidatus Saccharimonadales bacterium]